jgi:hypothetical protein
LEYRDLPAHGIPSSNSDAEGKPRKTDLA